MFVIKLKRPLLWHFKSWSKQLPKIDSMLVTIASSVLFIYNTITRAANLNDSSVLPAGLQYQE